MTLNAHANLFQMVGRLAAFHRPGSFTYAWHHNRQHERDFHLYYEMLIIDFTTTTTTEFIMHIGRQETPTSRLRRRLVTPFHFSLKHCNYMHSWHSWTASVVSPRSLHSAWSIHGRGHLANRQRCRRQVSSLFHGTALDPSYIIEHREEAVILAEGDQPGGGDITGGCCTWKCKQNRPPDEKLS